MIQNLLQQIGQLGAQNQGATGVQNGAGPSGVAPELGRTHARHVNPILERETGASEQPGGNRGVNAQSRGQIPEFPRELGGQVESWNEDCISETMTDWQR